MALTLTCCTTRLGSWQSFSNHSTNGPGALLGPHQREEKEMNKTSNQRYEDEWQAMPKWKRALACVFAAILPFIASIDSINF